MTMSNPYSMAGRMITTVLTVMVVSVNAAEREIEFNRDIRPILSDNCFHCHGPDAHDRKADLRLDVEDAAKANRDGDVAIVAGKPAESDLIERVFSKDRDEIMPPADSGKSLTDDQKALLRQWIEQGAAYQQHWAFVPVRKPVDRADAIDHLIKQRLKQTGMGLSPLADATTQLRRVTLDLTGLPPTIAETDAFLADVREHGLDTAYQAAVDRLLASKRYGEHMAWTWLEAARYADTDGYQNDGPRTMWRWRDWVIDAFNDNMPFDQFTIEQIAGDLLPNPTHDQLIATAFNRNHRYNSEAGIPLDEFLLENAVDRVETVGTVWMGLTLTCARCHNHKFDPFDQRDYYQLIDYFNDVAESGRAIKFGNSEPWIKSPTDDQRVKLNELEQRLAAARNAMQDAESDIQIAVQGWSPGTSSESVPAAGLKQHFTFDGDLKAAKIKVVGRGAGTAKGVFGQAASVDGTGHLAIGQVNGVMGNGRGSITFWMNPKTVDKGAVLSNEGGSTTRGGILVEMVEGRLRWYIIHRWVSGVQAIETTNVFKPGEWSHITLTNDGTQRTQGMAIYVNGIQADTRDVHNTNSNTAGGKWSEPMKIGFSKHVGAWSGLLDDLRIYPGYTISSDDAALLAVRRTPAQIAAMPVADRSKIESRLLRQAYLEQGPSKAHRGLLTALHKAEAAYVKYYDQLPTTMIMQDLPEGRPSYIRVRGVYDKLGDKVAAGVPAILPPLPDGVRNDRLAFARWLVSPDHPLTPRVTMNRYWQHFFGRGLVKTSEDFGSQGDPPTHPKLLEWLAATFVESGWDTKHMIKQIVTSHAYRQRSHVTSEHLRVDPKNELLARASRLRLPGNMLRDQALAVSGLLVGKLYGESVKPYQPKGMWREASNFTYKMDSGEKLYRRSLYTYWKRTLAPPTMAVLDTGDREYCTVKPKRTNTPLQALTLMNEVSFFEAARNLGQRMLLEGGDTDQDRIAFAFRTVATRMPTSAELETLLAALSTYRDEFKQDPKSATAALKVGRSKFDTKLPVVELAATTALANVLLNLDEVSTRE